MSQDSSIFSLLNFVESIDKITTNAVVHRVGKCEMSTWKREIMTRIEGLLKHASNEYAKLMNDCRTINRLPPEILLLVFSFTGRGISIFRISHVCKWWRQLSISSSALWTLYRPRRYPKLNMVFQRSKNALLDIRALPLYSEDVYMLSQIQMDRLRTVDVAFTAERPSSYEVRKLVEAFPSVAIHLSRLSLSTTMKGYQQPWDTPFVSTDFSSLFGGDMPRLRILRLHGIGIWPQFSGPSLQCLVLTKSTLPTLNLLSALQNLPCLEILVLASLSFEGPPHLPECVVIMECLRILHIKMETDTDVQFIHMHNLLSGLALHAGTAAHLEVADHSRDEQNTSFRAISSHWSYSISGMHTIYINGCQVIVSDDRSFIVYKPPVPNLTIRSDSGIFFGCFYCRLEHVTHLILKSSMRQNFDWRTLLGSLPLLEGLAMRFESYGRSDGELGRICDILLDADPIARVPHYALRLADITATIDECHSLWSIRKFIELLDRRCASGYPIKKVQLFDRTCVGLPNEYVEEIRKYVHSVTLTLQPGYGYRSEWRPQIPRHFLDTKPEKIYSEYFDF